MPFWRALFGIIFCYPCFKEMSDAAKTHGVSFPLSPGLIATIWIVLSITWRLPNPYWLICMTAPLVLLPVQNAVNNLNTIVAPGHDPNGRFSVWNIVGIVFGIIWLILVLIGTFSSQQP